MSMNKSAEPKILKQKVCQKNDLANNSMKEFEVNVENEHNYPPLKVLLIKQNNNYYAIGAKCSQNDESLVNGITYKGRIRCAEHGFCYNIKTGDFEDFAGQECIPKYEVLVDHKANEVSIKVTLDQLCPGKKPTRPKPRNSRSSNSSIVLIPKITRGLSIKSSKCLVIGSGPAGIICVETLRESGYSLNITLITNEKHLPYDRPKLIRKLDSKLEDILIRNEEYYITNQINLELDQYVESIDFEKHQVSTRSNKTFDFDKLIIASGMKPNRLVPYPGHDLGGIFTLRSYEDASKIMTYFNDLCAVITSSKINVGVIGGSYLANEVVSFFADKSNVTLFSKRNPYHGSLGALIASKIRGLHERKGTNLYINKKFYISEYVESKTRPGKIGAIKLQDHSEWAVDICIICIGCKPSTDFLKGSSLELSKDNFVVVDKYLRTNIPNVFAVGDITKFPRACLVGLEFTLDEENIAEDLVAISHWSVACSQGRTAALFGATDNPDTKNEGLNIVPFYWSTIYDKCLRFSGFNDKYDSILVHEDSSNSQKFAAFYAFDGRVIGVCTLDWDPVCALFTEALYNKIEVKTEHVQNDPLDLKKLLS